METVTIENLSKRLQDRDVRDILSLYPHPTLAMTLNGFTYLDYALWRLKSGRQLSLVVKTINQYLTNTIPS